MDRDVCHRAFLGFISHARRSAQLPEEARKFDKLLREVLKDKETAVREQNFKKAKQLHDKEMDLRAKIRTLILGFGEASKADADREGPVVSEVIPEVSDLLFSLES